MGSKWTVVPDDTKVELVWESPDGPEAFWIRHKKQLTVGEDKASKLAGLGGISREVKSANGTVTTPAKTDVDWQATSVVRTLTWLTDWSLADDNGNKLKMTRDVVEVLHPDVFELIENAITAYVESRAEEKKARVTKSELSLKSA